MTKSLETVVERVRSDEAFRLHLMEAPHEVGSKEVDCPDQGERGEVEDGCRGGAARPIFRLDVLEIVEDVHGAVEQLDARNIRR